MPGDDLAELTLHPATVDRTLQRRAHAATFC